MTKIKMELGQKEQRIERKILIHLATVHLVYILQILHPSIMHIIIGQIVQMSIQRM